MSECCAPGWLCAPLLNASFNSCCFVGELTYEVCTDLQIENHAVVNEVNN